MSATRLSFVLALSSLLSTSALAAEPFTAEQEQAKLLQLQSGDGPQGANASLGQEEKEITPQREEGFSTYWFVRTDWKVHNPNAVRVQVRVHCARYGYDAWYWIEPNQTIPGSWGCEGRTLYIFNNADQFSNLSVYATVW